ncbi:bifunctional 4-hydroxy-2-oxoglutarate aldolase/2-dehydro-3-deoxy-phosphogluconate aldolase [Robbsia sp. Bb-Pol-6]|uniref:2-dehydro-3-deoxy-phosphogluconate aldolase n=1 Tax=Robbsia betulipollinis TaxID=2981849 RepID=A0ABT3ZQQ6_9BURK|nr:bifunctional 4-hydroxy-2-oxoglutarate aldolase/2-dehydro-3-deoxy-phosphogluconate aldolase [Robbsia betulipollinis]MCY0388870.1 bifunctional 4-hydroxy-2-oxoglutarate aldolase/2-dehydro-3-deoxy-phosphogluconate aldolase [Robbsia betulipollinis]
MSKHYTVDQIVRLGPVIPVLKFDSVEEGIAVSRALYEGGVKVLEITLRTKVGIDVIREASQIADDIAVGVGTLTRPEECELAARAGATFGVSPGFSTALDQAAKAAGLPLLPGVMTPSDILAAVAAGYEIVKFFPAEQAGGTTMLGAFHGPFPSLRFCPTGGITPASAPSFLSLPNVVCVGGSWLTPRAAVAAKDWAEITRLAREASGLARAHGVS